MHTGSVLTGWQINQCQSFWESSKSGHISYAQGQGHKSPGDRDTAGYSARPPLQQSLDLIQRIMESMGLSGRMEDTAPERRTGKSQEWNGQQR